ncbi:putative copper resistance protein D [Motilibacter rhizosphaerae]|uniref:Putative copper resistance protein D n=1 Tax=Motilibacter rhizosphaerae TaxID=598652 RepID=A0A4Q7NS12_9ACTN|nr:bifunctional copper resistance protein CopD/cytochrome c oxidase assembly protein [Motilibacter rhizosphaerae]RZS89903.1 putative copper resistance protein D [Motilibacter rhizosphaerae]
MTATLERTATERATRPWGPPAVVLAVVVLVLAALVGGAVTHEKEVGVPDAGVLVTWGLLLTRLVTDLAGLSAAGLLLLAAVLLPNAEGALRGSGFHGVRRAGQLAAAWAVAALVEAVLTGADIVGTSVGKVLAPTLLRQTVDAVPQVRALLVQAALAAVLAVACRFVVTAGRAVALLVLALGTLVPPLLTGHSAAAGDHMLAISALTVHVLALALWLGGLGALVWMRRRSPEARSFPLAVSRFSGLALWCAVAVGVSGVVSAWLRLGSWTAITTTAYGGLVSLKTAGFLAVAAAGARHRSHTLPRLQEDRRAFSRLAAGEVLVMVATVGLAVALGRTPTPAPYDEASDGTDGVSLVQAELGFAPPPHPSLWHYVTAYEVDGFFLLFVLVAGILYAQGVLALRRRGDSWALGRTVSWYAGLALVLYTTCGGLAAYSHILFSAHMVAHMVLVSVAPIFLVLAAPTTLALRTLPAGSGAGDRGPRQALVAVLHSRFARVMTNPVVASLLFIGSLFGLYFTPLLDLLMSWHIGHTLMDAHFLAVGTLFFYVLVGVDPSPKPLPHLARLILVFPVMAFHAFFNVALLEENEVLAKGYYTRLGNPYGVNLLHDQQSGAALGWSLGEVPILLVIAAVFVAWVRADEREARRRDRAADRAVERGEEDELASYNAWLAAMNERAKGR